MNEHVLQTKISIPPLPRSLVVRQRSEGGASDANQVLGTDQQLTLVAAPAGYGKTTFARQWIRGAEGRCAWYALEASDNDRERFWVYLITALRRIRGDVGRATLGVIQSTGLLGDDAVEADAFLVPLLNDVFALDERLILVLDDYHLIDNSRIHKDMEFFFEHVGTGLHLVVTTRSEPPWPLARWRAHGRVREVRQPHLTFSLSDTKEFLEQRIQPQLTDEQVHAVHDRVAGWVTGLQLAALSLADQTDVDRFLATFVGSHRHVLHFLTEEVLKGVSPRMQGFLHETSLLDRLCPDLCRTVTGCEDSAALLHELERRNMFVIPLDDEHGWYRYHPLFADLLRQQLRRSEPGAEIRVHHRAAAWYAAAGEPGEALRHALRAHDDDAAVAMLAEHLETILATEGPDIVVQSLAELPADAFGQLPELALQRAWFHLVHRGKEQAWQCIAAAQTAVAQAGQSQERLHGILAVVTAYYDIYAHDFAAARQQAARALEQLPDDDQYWRSKVAIIAGDAQLFAGKPQAAYDRYYEAYRLNQTHGYLYLILSSGFKVASSLLFAGELVEAEALTRHLLGLAKVEGFARVPRVGLLWTLLGELLRERGDLDEALRCMERGLFISHSEKPSLGWNYLFRLAVAHSRRDYQDAAEVMNKLEQLHRAVNLPHFIVVPALTWKARLCLQTGRIKDAQQSLSSLQLGKLDEPTPGCEQALLLQLRCRMRLGAEVPEQTTSMVEQIRQQAETDHHIPVLLSAMWIRAELAEYLGDGPTAEQYLWEGLKIAWSNGYYQSVLDAAEPLKAVYQRLQEAWLSDSEQIPDGFAAYVKGILTTGLGFEVKGQECVAERAPRHALTGQPALAGGSHENLVEELTARELDVLHWLAAGLSNTEIAEQLFISPGTVKWHTSNVYGKLGVGNRTHAVALGRQLGLLA